MYNSNNAFIIKVFVFVLFLFSLTSCLRDATCYYSYQLNVNINASKHTVKQISLYVFDSNDLLYEVIDQNIDTSSITASFKLGHLPQGKYTYIAWGNLFENQLKPTEDIGLLRLEDAAVFLKKRDSLVHLSPDELFFGSMESTKRMYENKLEKMYISRYISGVTIKVYNALGYFSKSDTNFSIKLRGTVSTIPFDNDWMKSELTNVMEKDSIGIYNPPIVWKENNNLMQINRFYTLPSNPKQPIFLDLYHNEVLLQSFRYSNYLRMNKITDIILNLWNEDVDQWLDFNDWSSVDQIEDL